jgi:predicted Zn-dependent protease
MLEQLQAQNLCQQVLRRCGPDPAEVLLSSQEGALTRFANNLIHQNVAERNLNLIVRLHLGKRSGMASSNRTDPAAFDEVVARARANAQASPEDPNHPGLAEPAHYTPVESFDPLTAGYSPQRRAEQVGIVCRLADERGLNASGAFSTGSNALAIANSQGLFAYHPSTRSDFQTVIMAADASGHAHASSWQAAEVPVESLGREALEKAERGENPRLIEPGEYSVVFDPYVTEDLLNMLDVYGMGGQSVLEGTSWMNDRMGEKAMSSSVSIWDDGPDPRGLPAPFDYEGSPKQRVEIVMEGVVKGPVYDRYIARKAGATSTGHALPPTMRALGPLALNLFMAPGKASLEDMIHTTRRGLYVTRFWYTRLVHPRDCIVTGMTRDGVFMIENGELAYPVKNLRFTQSYVQALADVEAVSQETRLLTADYINLAARVPALKLGRFNFTGATV